MDSLGQGPGASLGLPSGHELAHRFTSYDYAVVLCMLVSSGLLGLYCAFADGPQKSIRQLLTADGQLPPALVSTSLMASFISASYILGNVTEIYLHGTIFFLSVGCYFLVIPITAHLYVPVFYRSGALTCYEYLELRYNRLIRVLALICYIIQMLMYLGIQLYVPALAISQATGIQLWPAVVAIGIVCTVYTSLGGIKAVVYTDSLQAVFMLVAMLIVVILGFRSVGGFEAAWRIAEEKGKLNFNQFSFDPTERHTTWGLIIGLFATNLASYATNQMMVLRYLTVQPLSNAKWVVWGNLPYLAFIFTLSCLSGLMAFAFFQTDDPVQSNRINSYDQLLPYFVMAQLGTNTGIPGVFVAGIFAASLSSISSGVNALANVLYVDVIALIWPDLSNKAGSRTITLLGAVCGLLTIALVGVAQLIGNAQAATNAVNSGLGGPLLSLFTVGMFLPIVNSKGALAGFISSLVISLWLNFGAFFNAPPEFVAMSGELYQNSTPVVAPTTRSFLVIYEISYVWDTSICVLIGAFVSIFISLVTGPQNPRALNPDLIGKPFDFFCPWLPQRTRDMLAFNVGTEYVVKSCQGEELPETGGRIGFTYSYPADTFSDRRSSFQTVERC